METDGVKMEKNDLLYILEDLKPDEFENFKWYLKNEKLDNTSPIKECRLSNAERRDVVDLMVQNYEFARAVEVLKSVLKKISRNDLVMKLPTIISGAEAGAGENRATQDNSDSIMESGANRRFAGQNENHSDNKVNLVLLGMSGTGKSDSGNTILGRTQFESRASSEPITTECQAAETVINGTRVRVIDTPDMFDDEIKSSVKKQHVTQCRQLCQSDPCVYLLVMHVSRFTDGERDILRKIEEAFGPEAKEQTIILFTWAEDVFDANMSLEDFLQYCEPELKNIVEQCGGRCVFFENIVRSQHQVAELMQTVNEMLTETITVHVSD